MNLARQVAQPHGGEVLVLEDSDRSETAPLPEADALITRLIHVPIVIRVADCGPVFLVDPVQRAIGLAHSGRKGTELNIVGNTISSMVKRFGTRPDDLLVQLGPCIRPPHYEVDFAQTIAQQAKKAGVEKFADCGICTACHLNSYYSYRAEKGQTGRMWAVLMLT